MREFHYRLAAAAGGTMPGAHRSRNGDGGFEFRGHAPLQDAPDPRRVDLQASLRDPFGQWRVRRYSLRKAVSVALVADLSASMGFDGQPRKLDVLADFSESLGRSAWRHGDSFAFVGCDEQVRREWVLPATRRRGAGAALASALRTLQPTGRSAQALADAHRHLPQRRSLVFVASDFHLALPDIERALASLAAHQVVPVVLWQAAEFGFAAPWGLAQVQEPEQGSRQWLWWRPALRARWDAAREQRRLSLLQLFARHRLAPLFIEGAFDADAVTRHFAA